MCVALSFLFDYLLSIRCVRQQIGRAFEPPIGYKPYWVPTCCSSTLLLPIFLERTTAEGKLFWKIWGFERGLSYQSQLVFICVLLKLGLDWEKVAQRNFEDLLKNSDGTLLPASGQFTGGEQKREEVTGCWNNTFPMTGQMVVLCPIKWRRRT